MTFAVIVSATASGTPRFRLMNRRTVGPSLRRKNVAKTENVRKNTSDVRPWMPFMIP